ncbi:MAG: molybdopterin dinucleotide binding domain-containing protein, partial [Thermodesulfobacteriota bacterium]
LEVYSNFIGKIDSLKAKGFTPMPSYVPVPEHEKMRPNELVLTTFKVNAQTHSRTQNCKLLSEIYHSNPAWIHPDTAKARGIKNGDKIRVKSPIGEIVIKARVTEGVHPKVIAISHHCGHWAYGRYASGKAVFPDKKDEKPWWTDHGVHPNWIIPNSPDPVAGALRWMDTVVKVEKA